MSICSTSIVIRIDLLHIYTATYNHGANLSLSQIFPFSKSIVSCRIHRVLFYNVANTRRFQALRIATDFVISFSLLPNDTIVVS